MSLEQAVNECTAVMRELISVLGTKGGNNAAPQTETAVEAPAVKRGPGRPPKPAPASPTPQITLDQVKAAANKLSAEKGRPVARKLIEEHGANSTTEMDPANYAKFIAAVDVLLRQKPEEDEPEEEEESDL